MDRALGQYRLVSELGRGGMGVVYKAHDPELDRQVAIKVLADALAHDPQVAERFQREARAMAALDDAHVVRVHAIGSSDGVPWFVMEYVDGISLDRLLQREVRLIPEQAVGLVRQAAKGLACAHDSGLVHRDVKPGNILLTTHGVVKLTDFGIALSTRQALPKLTAVGSFLGTPGYVAPEILSEDEVSARSDQFSLGMVLYKCLAGRLPYDNTSTLSLLREIIETPALRDVREFNPHVDADLARILARMTHNNPARRYRDCHALIEDLSRHGGRSASGVTLAALIRPEPAKPLSAAPRRAPATQVSAPRPRALPGVRRSLPWALAAVLLIIVASLAWWARPSPQATTTGHAVTASDPLQTDAAPASVPARSIAVLPFENLSDDKANAYFVDGLQDLILTKLAGIDGIKVASRTSTMRYQSHPGNVRQIAAELGVATILEGSVQRVGNEVLVTVQLIDASDNGHLWAETYRRRLTDVFGVEGEVAQSVASALHMTLSAAQTRQLHALPTDSQEAFDLFLRADYRYDRAASEDDVEGLQAAIALYRRAVEADPGFAKAWGRLVSAELSLASLGGADASPHQLYAQACRDATRTRALAPDVAATYWAIALCKFYGQGDYAAAIQALDQALRLNPDDTTALAVRGMIQLRRGHFDASVASMSGAVASAPKDSVSAFYLGWIYATLERYAEADVWFEQALKLDPDNIAARTSRATVALARSGDVLAALAFVQGADPGLKLARADLLVLQRRYRDAIALLKAVPDSRSNFTPAGRSKALQLAVLHQLAGDRQRARELFAEALGPARAQLQRQQRRHLMHAWQIVARIELGLGQTSRALGAIAHAEQVHDTLQNPVARVRGSIHGARLYALAGRPERAVPLLQKALSKSIYGWYPPVMLWLDPVWEPMRERADFRALLRQYARHKPG